MERVLAGCLLLLTGAPLVLWASEVEGAGPYAFTATVSQVETSSLPGRWDDLEVGQGVSGVVGYDVALEPSGFTGPGMATSFFEGDVTYDAKGIALRVDVPSESFRVDRDPTSGAYRIERTSGGTDLRMQSDGSVSDEPDPDVVIEVELDLDDIGTPVDYLMLPDPLEPPVPAAGNRIVLRAQAGANGVCPGTGSCLLVADITSFETAPDADRDGVPDVADNCPIDPNGPLACTRACCDQLDGDQDGYGNPCDFDPDNDGGESLLDVSWTLTAAVLVLADPNLDHDCDGGVSLLDVSLMLSEAGTPDKPGPSGLACAGRIPCP